MSTEKQLPPLGTKMMVEPDVTGVVVEHHPQSFLVRLHMLAGLDDYGTTNWFDPASLWRIEVVS